MTRLECDEYEKKLPNYKIFWVDSKQLKHVIKTFKAGSDEEALARLEDFMKEDFSHKFYYGKMHYVRCMDSSGDMKIRALEDHSDPFEDSNKKNFLFRALSSIGDFFAFWLWQKPVDWWYSMKDVVYLLKHREARSNQWNLDMHLVDSIILNVPSLIENSHSMMFLDDAILKLHENDKDFDLKQYHLENCCGYPEEVESLAMEIQHEEYKRLLLDAKLYKYYLEAGIIDTSNEDEVKFDEEWRHTLPVKQGTYDEFDYDKLKAMIQAAWNNVWDWVKKHGHTLCD